MRNSCFLPLLACALVLFGCATNETTPYPESGYTHTLDQVKSENTLPNGTVLRVAPEDLKYIEAILYRETTSPDAQSIDRIASYGVALKQIPQKLTLTLDMPSVEGRVPALFVDGVWREAPDYVLLENGVVRVTLGVVFAQTKAMVCDVVQVGLLDKKAFYTEYTLTKAPFLNMLAARATFQSTADVSLECTVVGQNDNDIISQYKPSKEHKADLVGLYAHCDTRIRYLLKNSAGVVLGFDDTLHCNVPYFNNVVASTRFKAGFRNDADEIYLASSVPFNINLWPRPTPTDELFFPVGYDQWGKVRLVFEVAGSYSLVPIDFMGKPALASIQNDDLVILSAAGEELMRVASPEGHPVHHEIINITPTRLALGSSKLQPGRATDEYGIIEFDLQTKQFSNDIDFRSIITTDRALITTDLDDIIHTNAIAYSATDDCFVVSARQQGVAKIKRTTHELIWLLTPHVLTDKLTPEARAKLLAPTNFRADVADDWNLGQHACTILPNGDIMVFDNHNQPLVVGSPWTAVSHITSYKIDERAMTVTKTWDFSTADKKFSMYMGSAYLQRNGNVLGGWPVQQYACEVKLGTNEVQWEGEFKPLNKRGDIYRTYKVKLNR